MKSRRSIRFVALTALALVVVQVGLMSSASAQDGVAQMSVRTPTDIEIKQGGEDVRVEVLASDVTNLAAFQFTLEYDPSILEYQAIKETAFLGSTGRTVQCAEPLDEHTGAAAKLHFACATLGAPVSLGGAAGPDGSGTLAEVTFSPKGGGTSPLDLSDDILVAAEINEQGAPVQIESTAQGASLEVIGSGGGFPWLIVAPVLAVAAVVAAGGGGMVMVRRSRARRQA
jgi:hypothetical protein